MTWRRALLPFVLGAIAGCGPAPPFPIVIPTTTAPATAEVTVAACVSVAGKADRRCTPGTLNPDVTQATISTTICVPGWAGKVRPPARDTNRVEVVQIAAYGLPGGPDDYKNDHLIPISLGGALLDAQNLHPQTTGDAARKDRDAHRLKRAVCDGRMTLVDAQVEMRALWVH